MSTRNLSRTIIEGGRGSHFSRTYSTRVERREYGALLHRIGSEEDWLDAKAEPKRDAHHGGFADKLAPLRRWLQSHAGKPWNDVYSILRQRFDYRTMKGHHLLDDHAKQFVTFWWEQANYRYKWRDGLHVTEDGILRYTPEKRGLWRSPKKPKDWLPGKALAEIERWMCGRSIGQVGSVLFWFVSGVSRADGYQQVCNDSMCWRQHIERKRVVERTTQTAGRSDPPYVYRERCHVVPTNVYGARQDRALSKEDLAFWARVDDSAKKRILEESPVAPKDSKKRSRYLF